jgi:uncharacterized protein YceK
MRRVVVVLVVVAALAGCSSSTSTQGVTAAVPKSWSTPTDVLDGVRAAGFDCTLPSSDTTGQVLTTDPLTGKDLAGNALVRCPDFQVMLAARTVQEGFALLAACQVVSDTVRQSAAWTTKVLVGANFAILPADLTAGWTSPTRPAELTTAFGTSDTTFGVLYDQACAGYLEQGSGAPPPAAVPTASPTSP